MTRIQLISKRFSELIREELTSDLREVVRLNREEKSRADKYCHTHDYCDANVFMGQAFQEVIGRPLNVYKESDLLMWNRAWTLSKKNEFQSIG